MEAEITGVWDYLLEVDFVYEGQYYFLEADFIFWVEIIY